MLTIYDELKSLNDDFFFNYDFFFNHVSNESMT
jgi:hypothetical protein